MDRNYALEPEEVAAGIVLACQSHPVTDAVSPRLRRLTAPPRRPTTVGRLGPRHADATRGHRGRA